MRTSAAMKLTIGLVGGRLAGAVLLVIVAGELEVLFNKHQESHF